jgi:crotonobetainyl-CoA:carnitine CoA-transferase CaiB-like acyl-CoA transferase
MLEDVRVVDLTTDIAGPYCTKMLADAGADVVKVETGEGDPLRHWGSGALFEFLNTSKRSVNGNIDHLIAAADILVTDAPVDVDELRSAHQGLVVVTITPFGSDGPWAHHPSTEFTLQATCGSTGQRGLPEQPPLAAGGRIGEWITGSYGAVGAIGAYREALRCGQGDHVDVAMLDCMAVSMVTYPSVFASFAGWPPQEGTGRMIEVPSIEPTADGFVVFTTNSAQQFQDFLVMIGRPDLLADRDLAKASKRFARRDEFLTAVRQHTARVTTEEILEAASLFRIPAGPVLDGSTALDFEPFAVRGIFNEGPSGRFCQPRVPYRISGAEPRPFRPAPINGEHTNTVEWSPADRARRTAIGDETEVWQLPLRGVRVIDCTAWWAGPAATHALACLGADVVKVESVTRPDYMRLASTRSPRDDQWCEWGPLFHGVNVNKRAITLDLTHPEGVEAFERLVETADVLVENYTPRVMDQFGLGWSRIHEINPELIMVRMTAFGLDGPWRDRTGFAQTMECLSGMAWLTGFVDGPPVLVRGACDPLAGMHSVFATLLALFERDQSGGGRLVEAVMVEAALNAAAEQTIEFGTTGAVLGRNGNRGPVAAPQGIYPCAGDDRWIALAVTSDDEWRSLCSALGKSAWADEDAMASTEGRRRLHDQIDAALAAWTRGQDAEATATLLVDLGVPAAEVAAPRDIASNPQLRSRSLFEVEHHAVTGDHEIPMLPFRYSRIDKWIRSPAPTLGEHNDEVLGDIGLSEAAIGHLRDVGIVGETLVAP